MYIIRKAQLSDVESIRAQLRLLNELHQKALPNDFKSCDEIVQANDIAKHIENDKWVGLVGDVGGQIAGFVTGNIWQRNSWILQSRMLGGIQDIFVAEDFRGTGLGKALVEQLKFSLKDLGAEEIWTEVYEFNQSAKTFYQSCGMEPLVNVYRGRI